MKATLLAFLVLSTVTSTIVKAQYPSPFKMQHIDTVNGSKSDLYVKANQWLAKTFNSAKAVIQIQDKEAGKIIGKGAVITMAGVFNNVEYVTRYTIFIDVKDNKYRIVISDCILEGYHSSSQSGEYNYSLDNEKPAGHGTIATIGKNLWHKIKDDCARTADNLIDDFMIAIKANTDSW